MNGKVVSGLYLGAGTSSLYLGLGFVPDKVVIRNIDQAAQEELIWNIHMARAATAAEGILRTTIGADDTGLTVLTKGAGVAPYYGGGAAITTLSSNYQVPADSVAAYQGDMRQKTGSTINKWTLGSAANYTGNWNVECDTTYVGVGSPVTIKDNSGVLRTAFITALTSNGEAANEVTLSQPLASGEIVRIGYMYDFIACPVGRVMPAGIVIDDATYVNVSAQKCLIEAYGFDQNI